MRSLAFLLLAGLSLHAQPPSKLAQEKPAPSEPKPYKPAAIEPKDGKLTIPILLHPNGVSRPYSRHYLTPQYPEMKPGNRVPTFMRAFMEQDQFFAKEQREKRDRWNLTALDDLPLDEIRNSGCIGGLAYRKLDADQLFMTRGRPLGDIDEGARQLSSDWQIWFNLREDGIGTLLPEVQKIRELANVLQVRMRYEIRTGDFEKAIFSARTFHGLASSFETHPTLIGLLVGLAIKIGSLDALEEMVQQPGCPNLYWGFTELPAFGLDDRVSTGGERLLAYTMFKPFVEATEPMTETELYRHLKLFDVAGAMANAETGKWKYSLDAPIRATDKKKVAAARKLLVDTGTAAKVVDKMSELQAVVTADIRQYEIALDEMLIANSLPFAEAMKQADAAESRMKAEGAQLARLLTPTNRKITAAVTRTRQRIAYLRVLEAIRLYAHEKGGQLPAKLADLTVPVPLDPVTGKPFAYSVDDGKATLTGGNPSDIANNASTNRVYQIRVKK
jgi:hypothetical protein